MGADYPSILAWLELKREGGKERKKSPVDALDKTLRSMTSAVLQILIPIVPSLANRSSTGFGLKAAFSELPTKAPLR